VSGKPETARSYRGAVVDDNAIISINIKWLLQSAVVIAGLVYSYYSVIQRITELERKMSDANNTITELVEKHIVRDLKEMQELTVLFWENRMYNPTIKMAEA
jgi:hypothetical protein